MSLWRVQLKNGNVSEIEADSLEREKGARAPHLRRLLAVKDGKVIADYGLTEVAGWEQIGGVATPEGSSRFGFKA